jgi:hypothetical protein
MITGTLPAPTPAIWDTTVDYDEASGDFYARSDIDHKVLIRPAQAIWVNTDTGERKTDRKNWKP